MIAWGKYFFAVSFFVLSFSVGSPALATPELLKSVKKIANEHYFREEAIILLYDRNMDYEKAFNCKKITQIKNGIRTDAICSSVKTKDVFSFTIRDGKRGYPSYVLVCPAGFDELDPFKIASSAFQSDSTVFDGHAGTSYYMGRTNGWIKDFENLLITVDFGLTKASCWGLDKR